MQMIKGDGNPIVANGDQDDGTGRLLLFTLLSHLCVDCQRLVVTEINLDGHTTNDWVLHGSFVVPDHQNSENESTVGGLTSRNLLARTLQALLRESRSPSEQMPGFFLA